MIEAQRENLSINKLIAEKKEIIFAEGDMIVPDSKPDILNTICTSGVVSIYKKEAQEDWECIGHRIFRKNEFMNRIYIFQNVKTGEVHTLELFDSSFQSIQGQTFDNVICLDDRLTEEVKKRTLGYFIVL